MITATYAAVAIDGDLGRRLEAARRRRNRSEYGVAYFDQAAVADIIDLAERLAAAVG
ncbi:MAG: hypothetical protein ACRDNM_05920 [Gaiellaceae bacterium]